MTKIELEWLFEDYNCEEYWSDYVPSYIPAEDIIEECKERVRKLKLADDLTQLEIRFIDMVEKGFYI